MKGRLTQWDDAKGYGFITPDDGGPKLFVHAKAFGLRPQRPVVGERLSYREGQDAQGKRRAQDVRSLEPRAARATAGCCWPSRRLPPSC
jgi:cold shock CspA family protein